MDPKQDFQNKVKDEPVLTIVGPMNPGKIKKKCPHIFVDGGAKYEPSFLKEQNIPTLSLGDADSFNGELDILLPKEKDYSDLSYALSIINELSFKEIFFHGFLGGLRDHELINLGEIFHFLKFKEQVRVFLEDEVIGLAKGRYNFDFQKRFSIVSFVDCGIKLDGQVLYPILEKRIIPPLSSLTLSNQAQGPFEITSDNPLFLLLS